MKLNQHNIEVGTLLLNRYQCKIGIVDQVISFAPYLSVEVLYMGSSISDVVDQHRLSSGEFEVIPTLEIAP